MEKDRFNYLVSHYNSLNQQETAELRLEQDRFGYCQVLHQLIARGDHDNQTEMKDISLQTAAVYSTDRSVLKQIMTMPRVPRAIASAPLVTEVVAAPIKVEMPTSTTPQSISPTPQKEETKQAHPQPVSESAFDVDAVLSKFLADLKPMHEKKLLFEKTMEEFEKNLKQAPVTPAEKPKRKPKAAAVNTSEQLLQEIKTTKKKIAPENPRQKEQIEIIDQFIKTKPSISKPTATQAQLDLTELTETYTENVVSETLAIILIKQGKKDKAIEVLRKLIWKFPQKKAYFAAQIEDLTK